MRVLITGVCGFVGNALTSSLRGRVPSLDIFGIDNLARPGSERQLPSLKALGVTVVRGDLRCRSDLDGLPPADWVIDAAALPSVIGGVDGRTSSRQVVEHNLIGTLNLAEYCRRHQSGCILLSTSRVYSIETLANLPFRVQADAFVLDEVSNGPGMLPAGVSAEGIDERFSTTAPVSIYGATKLASETMMLEFGAAHQFPVWVNRCGVLAGAGQLARSDQGIFPFWIDSHRKRSPLKYFGFGGTGHQVRDCLHPDDLAHLVVKQLNCFDDQGGGRIFNVGGGRRAAISLKQLTRWCDQRFGEHAVVSSGDVRPFDLPWIVMDSRSAETVWGWKAERSLESILDEIAAHCVAHPDWLELPH